MYYVDTEQIEQRLQFLPYLGRACRLLAEQWVENDPLYCLAQERTLHLAIETVTDVGSLLIDGFLMRDASSYEDIIEIIRGEEVLSEAVAAFLIRLVQLRKPLVQEFIGLERSSLHPLVRELPDVLDEFAESVRRYLQRELF